VRWSLVSLEIIFVNFIVGQYSSIAELVAVQQCFLEFNFINQGLLVYLELNSAFLIEFRQRVEAKSLETALLYGAYRWPEAFTSIHLFRLAQELAHVDLFSTFLAAATNRTAGPLVGLLL